MIALPASYGIHAPVSTGPSDRLFGLHFDGADGSSLIIDTEGHAFSNTALIRTDLYKFGGAALHLSSTLIATTSTSPDYLIGTSDWTLQGWVNVYVGNVAGDIRTLFYIATNETFSLSVYKSASGQAAARIYKNYIGLGGEYIIGNIDTWIYIVIFYKDGYIHLYADGALKRRQATSFDFSHVTTGQVQFGGGTVGRIDDFEFWKKSLYTYIAGGTLTNPAGPFT